MSVPAVIDKGGIELLIDLERQGALTATGLHLHDPDLSYETFEAIGFLFGRMHQTLRFAIGDWLLLGERLYPERVWQAADCLGISEEGMKEYVRVSERVPRSIRREELSWSHHRAVAGFRTANGDSDYKLQKRWLKLASEHKLSHHQLRDALRTEDPPAPSECRCCHRPF